MQNLNKRAISDAISTFALIIVAITAILLAANSVISLLRLSDIQSSPAYNCFEDTTSLSGPSIQITSACLNKDNEIEATVRRNTKEFSLNSISFTLESETWSCSPACGDCEILAPGTTKTYFLTPNSNPLEKTITLYADSCELGSSVIRACQ